MHGIAECESYLQGMKPADPGYSRIKESLYKLRTELRDLDRRTGETKPRPQMNFFEGL